MSPHPSLPASPPPSPPASEPAFSVVGATVIPWQRVPDAKVVDVEAPTGGAFEVPGPRRVPVRPHLELAGSPAGLAGRVVQGDGTVAALALRDSDIVALAGPALAVSARSDGLWVMYRDRLVHHDKQGAAVRTVALSGIALVGSTDDAVWLAGADQAYRIAADGAVGGPWPWRDPLTSFGAGARLCARDRGDARALVCLAADGARTSAAVPELAPLEQPIALDGDRLITLQGTTLRLWRGAVQGGSWTLQVAGIDAGNAGFVVTTAGEHVTLWRAGSPARTLRSLTGGALSAASVERDSVVLYGQGHAATYAGSAAATRAAIDEAGYRAAIFPAAWQLASVRGIAASGTASLVVSASGPAGLALIALRVAR